MKGFTLIEIIMVVAITSILGGMAFVSFGKIINYNSIEAQAESVRSHIERARIFTLASKNNSSFGVYFSSTSARVFQGTTFISASSSDQVYVIDSNQSIININFSGGGSTIYFNKITGEPNATGTIVITSKNNNEDQRTVVIHQTGIVDIQ